MDVNQYVIADAWEIAEFVLEANQEAWQRIHDWDLFLTGTFGVAFPLFAVVCLVTLIGRRWFSHRACFLLWSLVLIRLILPVSIQSPISIQTAVNAIKRHAIARTVPDLHLLSVDAVETDSSTPSDSAAGSISSATPGLPSPTLSVPRGLLENTVASWRVLMISGSMLIAGMMLVRFVRTSLRIRHGSRITDSGTLDLLEEERRRSGVRGKVALRSVHELKGLVTFDWFWPVILLPEGFAELPRDDKRYLLLHELSRIRCADSASSLLLALVHVLHWWNPLYWWVRRCWLTERELACDELVRRYLPSDEFGNYLTTIDRQSGSPARRWSILRDDIPGFVAGTSSPAILRKRLISVSCRDGSSGRWAFWLSSCAVIAIAVTGLCDAVKEPLENTPIELPAGTIWDSDASKHDVALAVDVRQYDLTACIHRLCKEDPTQTSESVAAMLQTTIDRILSPFSVDASNSNSQSAGGNKSHSRLDHSYLLVEATGVQHDVISKLLSNWSAEGQKQITIEFRTYQTPLQISEIVPPNGGYLVNPHSASLQLDTVSGDMTSTAPNTSARQSDHSPIAVFVRNLASSEASALVRRCTADARCSCLMAPKITVFEGQTAQLLSATSRPFVTGYAVPGGQTPVPRTSIVQDGIFIETMAFAEHSKTHLSVACRLVGILDVGTRKLLMSSEEFTVQVPQITQTSVESKSIVAENESLVLIPLKREPKGLLTVFLITPKQLTIEPEENLLPLSTAGQQKSDDPSTEEE